MKPEIGICPEQAGERIYDVVRSRVGVGHLESVRTSGPRGRIRFGMGE